VTQYVNKGDFASEDEALRAAVRALVAKFHPAEIWLFGSRVSSHPRPEADFDLLLVHRPDYADTDDFAAPHLAVAALNVAADIVPCSYQIFKESRGRRAGLIPHILATGKQIYRRQQ
jgi:predicted nucleotidyltransferase